MQVSELSVRTGEVHISGQIEYLQYTENQQSKNRAVAAGPPAALMVPSPPLWAVLGDVLLCLGAGLLLGAVRDGATLAFGSGPVRCFVWDVLPCCRSLCLLRLRGGGFGYRGGALVYGRRHGAGGTVLAVVRFPRGAQGAARHGVCSWSGRCALRADYAVHPFKQWLLARIRKIRTPGGTTHKIHARKAEKKPKKCVAKQAHNII